MRLLIFILSLLLSPSLFAGTFYIAANGVDTNNGTTTGTPWLHAPGMPNCANSCSAHTPVAGDRFIFRGGDTWHFASGSPATGGTWLWNWSGSSGNNIYIGVDQTFFNGPACGASWCRPILNADNALSASTTLSSCTFQIGTNNRIVSFISQSFITFDNFEMLGLCSTSVSAFAKDNYITESAATHMLYQNLYVHGWTHVQFGVVNMQVFLGNGGSAQVSNIYEKIVIDGADSDIAGIEMFRTTSFDIHQSVLRNATQILGGGGHLFHDNLVENIVDPGDGVDHGNTYESVGEAAGTNAFYNNVIRHIYNTGIQAVNFWLFPLVGTTDYVFNNVMYDVHPGGNYFNIGENGSDQGTIILFNNTFESPDNVAVISQCTAFQHPFSVTNDFYITGVSAYAATCVSGGQGTFTTELPLTSGAATSQGFTPAQTFAFSPTLVSNSTVSSGTNKQSFCSALTTASGSDATLTDAATACRSDTTYACSYNSSNHTVSCPARTVVARPTSTVWDIGAYQFLTQPSPSAPSVGMFSFLEGIIYEEKR